MRIKALAPLLLAVALAAAPAAEGHKLTKGKARHEAKRVGAALGVDLGGTPDYRCSRRTRHKVDCQISLVTLDGSVCVSVVRVKYRNHRSNAVRRRVVSGPDCEPPELPLPNLP